MATIFVLKRRLRLGFSLAIILVLGIGALSYYTFLRQAEQSQLVNYSYRIINQVELVEKTLIDMETGRRGFRSTNNKAFLQPYDQGLKNLEPIFSRLLLLVADNEKLETSITSLKYQTDSLLLFWKSLGTDASQYSREQISTIQEREKVLMDNVRLKVAHLLDSQRKILAEREEEHAVAITNAKAGLVFGIILILLIVVLLIYQLIREFNQRSVAQQLLSERNKQLEQVNAEREEHNWMLSGLAELNTAISNRNYCTNKKRLAQH